MPLRAHSAGISRVAAAALVSIVVAAASLVAVPGTQAAVTETGSERFEGSDRYETSVSIARAYLAETADNLDRAPVSAVIVVSGEDRHAAYAMPAAGLASAFDAPIVMTPAGRLHRGVATFLDEHSFDLALVLGGAGVVSAAVVDDLEARVGSVRRIEGADQYETAVAVAGEVGPIPGSAGEWGSRGRTALLANGATITDALVTGPLAYHGEHPLLLTPGASLDGRVSDYLDRSDVEHVVVLGGAAVIGAAVVSAVQAKGIVVTRIAGADRYGTAAALARRLLGSGRPDPCFDGSVIGLATGERAPDAIGSGPLLGERCAPLLLVRPRAVPAATDDLVTGGDLLGGSDGRLDVVVFGGTAAIAEPTVTAVRSNAQRGEPFTAEVSASAGSTTFMVTYNEDVKEEAAINPERYTVNNAALALEGDTAATGTPRRYSEIRLSGRTVTIELVEPLAVGNTITVVGETGTPEGRTQIAVDDTLPALESVFYRVPRPPAVTDSTGPQVQIVAVAGEDEFVVLVAERALRSGDRLRNDVVHRGQEIHELTVVDADGVAKAVTFVPSGDTGGSCPLKPEDPSPRAGLSTAQAAKIGEQCYEDPATLGANLRYTAMVSPALDVGDVITVNKGALADQRRNPNRLTRYTVTEHADNDLNGDFTVRQAAVGTPRHTKHASLYIRNNTCGATGTDDCEGRKRVRITARATGIAAGAAGNGWIIYPFVDPSRTEPAESEIDVGVDPVHRIISYTFADGKITLDNLAAALNADATFRRHFSARVVSSGTLRCSAAAVTAPTTIQPVGIADAAGGAMCGGFSTVGVRVTFTDNVKVVTGANRFVPSQSLADLFLDGGDSGDDNVVLRCQRRGPVVYLEYVATDDALMPRAGTPVRVPAGVANNYADTPNLARLPFNLRLDDAIPNQFGYEQTQLVSTKGTDAPGQRCDGAN